MSAPATPFVRPGDGLPKVSSSDKDEMRDTRLRHLEEGLDPTHGGARERLQQPIGVKIVNLTNQEYNRLNELHDESTFMVHAVWFVEK